MGSATAVTNKNVCGPLLELPFVSIMRRMRQIHPLGHMLFLTKSGLTQLILQNGLVYSSQLDFGILLDFLPKFKSSLKEQFKSTLTEQKVAVMRVFQRIWESGLKATLEEESKIVLSKASVSKENTEASRRAAWKRVVLASACQLRVVLWRL